MKNLKKTSFILSIKMMLEWLGNKKGDQKALTTAATLENSVLELVKSGVVTKDIGGTMSTKEFTLEITKKLLN